MTENILSDDATPTSLCHPIITTSVHFELTQRRLNETQGVFSLTRSVSEPTQSQLRLVEDTLSEIKTHQIESSDLTSVVSCTEGGIFQGL